MADTTFDVLIRIQADLSNMSNQLASSNSRLSQLGNSARTQGGIISNALSFAGGLGITNAILAIGSKIWELGKKGIETASNLAEVQNVVDTTFGAETAQKIDTWANKALNAFGLSELQAKNFSSSMGAMLKSSGLAGDKVFSMSTNITGLAGDMASFYNLPHDEAWSKLSSGISGETAPLKALGINMSVANLEAYALTQGISQSWKEMDQASQTSLRYGFIMNATKDAQGDFARTSEGFANQFRLLTTNVEQLAGKLAQPFLPIFSETMVVANQKITIFREAFEKTGSVIDSISSILNVNGNAFKNITDVIMPPLQRIFKVITETILPDLKSGFTTLANGVMPIINKAFDYISKNILPPLIKVFEFLSITILPKFSESFKVLAPQVITVMNNMWDVIKPIMDLIVAIFNYAWPYIKQIIITSTNGMIQNVKSLINIFKGITDFVAGVFTGDWKRAWEGIKTIFTGVVSGFGNIMDSFVDIGANIIKGLWNGIKSMDAWITAKITEFVKGIGKTIKDFFGISSPAKLTEEYGINIGEGLGVGISKTEKAANDSAKKLAQEFINGLEEKAKAAQEAAKNIAQKTIDGLNSLGDAIITALKSKWTQEETMQLASLAKQSEALKLQVDENIKQYDRDLKAKLKTIDDSSNAEIRALQKQISAVDDVTNAESARTKELDYDAKLKAKQGELAMLDDPSQRFGLSPNASGRELEVFLSGLNQKKLDKQKEIDTLIAEHAREFQLLQRQYQKEDLQKQIDNIKLATEDKRKEAEKESNQKKVIDAMYFEQFNTKLNEQTLRVKTQYETLLAEDNIQATARYIALDKNQSELITLLGTYNPKWQDAGQTFGEKIIEGLNSTKANIQTAVNQALAMVSQLVASQATAKTLTAVAISAGGKVPKFANGTNFAPGGMALVGEAGPELVNLPRGSRVTPNSGLGNINITIGNLVGSNGMQELGNILSKQLNRKYTASIGGGVF